MSEESGTLTEVNSTIKEDTKVGEEYAYLDRGGFSSEKFKIELSGLPKFYGIAVRIFSKMLIFLLFIYIIGHL